MNHARDAVHVKGRSGTRKSIFKKLAICSEESKIFGHPEKLLALGNS